MDKNLRDIRVMILAGGLGTRISEETKTKPKPMVLINKDPIIWHLISIFHRQGLNDYILAVGYLSNYVKDWVKSNPLIESTTIDEFKMNSDKLKVLCLDTGLETQTGGRIKRTFEVFPDRKLLVTYGDGLANISVDALLEFHKSHGKLATVTAVHPPARFGHMDIKNNKVEHFGEKNQSDEGWINGGFFVLEPEVASYIFSDNEPFEVGALPRLAEAGELMAYHHNGFWKPMDALRDRDQLSELAKQENPPWFNFRN